MKRTKWEILVERRNRIAEALQRAEDEFIGLGLTPFKDGNEGCTSCGAPLVTEADFAKHYLIDDERYLNLGNCPTRYNNGKLMPSLHVGWVRKDLWDEAHQENKDRDHEEAAHLHEHLVIYGHLEYEGCWIDDPEHIRIREVRERFWAPRPGTEVTIPLTRHICTECGAVYHSDEEKATICNRCSLCLPHKSFQEAEDDSALAAYRRRNEA